MGQNLSNASFEIFIPWVKKKRFIRGSSQSTPQPFFPCYIFVRFEPSKHYHTIKYTRGVRDIVGTPGSPWPVSDELIDIIKSQINEEGFVITGTDIEVGDTVEIMDQPLEGFAGIFESEMKDSDRVIVLLNTIAYQARVEIERGALKKL